MTAKVTDSFSLSGGLEAMHATFTSYASAVGSIPKPTGGATLIVVNATGDRVPLAQNFTGTLAADYEQPVSFGSLHYNITANYNGDYYFEPDNFLRQGAYTLVNASLTWKSVSRPLFGQHLGPQPGGRPHHQQRQQPGPRLSGFLRPAAANLRHHRQGLDLRAGHARPRPPPFPGACSQVAVCALEMAGLRYRLELVDITKGRQSSPTIWRSRRSARCRC